MQTKIKYPNIKINNNGLVLPKIITHFQNENKDYFSYKTFFSTNPLDKNQILYYIYRNACLDTHEPLFLKNGVRFDLTLIPASKNKKEPSRTIGHFHKNIPKTKTAWSEIYEVINGQAIFFLQNKTGLSAYAISAKKGDKIIIPPNFGHITINPSQKNPLLIANIFTNKKNVSDYSYFKKNHGPVFYPIFKGKNINFIKNPLITKASSLITKKASDQKLFFKIDKKEPIYSQFIKNPRKFRFLISPK